MIIYEITKKILMSNYIMFLRVLLIFSIFYKSEVFSKQSFTLECKILMELENDQITKKKMYDQKSLLIYIDKRNSWINDLSFENWLSKNSEDQEKIEKSFEEDKKRYFFILRIFSDKDKQKLESSDLIKYEKFGGDLAFKKNFYDYEGKVFFSSEVSGRCKKK